MVSVPAIQAMRPKPAQLLRWLMCYCLLASISGCALPALEGRSISSAAPAAATQNTLLGHKLQRLRQQAQPQEQDSGILPLATPSEALAARVLLAQAAEKTLDVQYYIWRSDTSGLLLLQALWQAAERGVRVRLLLDDGGTSGLDSVLHALNQHPRIEVRLFNPFVLRWPKSLGYVLDFARANRRMHNKSFTADSQASIVGGRNIGDEYFGSAQDVLFYDLDVLATGPVVQDIAQDFDRYWASLSAYPLERIVTVPYALDLPTLRARLDQAAHSLQGQHYQHALQQSSLQRWLQEGRSDWLWAPAHLVSDSPAKALGQASGPQLIGTQLARAIGQPLHTVDLVSPYFVPTSSGIQALQHLRDLGIQVRVLTNALEATDVPMVHIGYARYRPSLLAMGVQLYELRRQAPAAGPDPLHERRQRRWLLASSGSSLHAKTFAIDGQRAFVGSLNFDPRSVLLNTEMGLLIESPVLAERIHSAFDEAVPWHAYRVQLGSDGRLQWHSVLPDTLQPYIQHHEPNSRWYKRWGLWLLQHLPIEPLL